MYLIALFFTPFFAFAQEVEESSGTELPLDESGLDERRRQITEQAPEEIMRFSLADSAVSLFMTGSWKGTLQGDAGFTVSPLGTSFASPETPLLFTQDADLTLSLWLNKRWFVEANFLDDSAQNTYRAGYQGLPGEFIKYAAIGNTGLDFPSFPYLDLGGDSPSSFGFYSRMGTGEFDIHTLFRYDAAAREEKVFSGGRERSYSYVQIQNSVRAVSFVLPDINIDSDITVYIEDKNGSLRDSNGRRWRLVLPSEYAAGKTQGLLDLNIRSEGMIAVSYSKNGNARPWNVSMGSYNGGDDDFLSKVQQWFPGGIDLEKYPQPGGDGVSNRPGEVVINGAYALVVRESGTFSPFERRSRYESPSSASEQVELVRLSNGTTVNGFEIVPLDVSAASADIPLYTAAVTGRVLYELLPSGSNFSMRDAQTLWPFAREYPEIYLPASGTFTSDVTLRFTNFGGAGGFVIGTDVVPGSIQVWRSGIQDTNFRYDASAGEVALSRPAGQNELIRITYLKRSDQTRLGSFAAGAGVVYHRDGSPFTASAALGVRMNLAGDTSYTEEEAASPGSVGLSAKAAWDYDDFKAHISAAFAVDQIDTTGLYRAAGMEGSEYIFPLPPDTSFISNPPHSYIVTGLDNSNRAELIYRNYINSDVLGSNVMSIDWNGSTVVTGRERPYPAKDPQIKSAQSLVAEFTLDGSKKWTGFEVPVIFDTDVFSRAVEIEIPYRLYNFNKTDSGNFKLIFQLGALSGKDFAFTENPALVWETQLFPRDGESIDSELKIARFTLKDEDRIKLADVKHLRVIAYYDGIGDEITGRVILSPPIVRGSAFRAITYDGDTVNGVHSSFSGQNRVTAVETMEGASLLKESHGKTIGRLHLTAETQRVLKIEWENMDAGVSAGVDGRVGELPLSDYGSLSFFFRGGAQKTGTLSFIAAAGPDSFDKRYLEAHIPLSALGEDKWSKVTIRYQGDDCGITVDGKKAAGSWSYRPAARYSGEPDKPKGTAGYIAVLVNPDTKLDDARVFIDEIILEEPALVYRVNAGAAAQYSKKGAFLSVGGVAVLSDFSVSSALESEVRAMPEIDEVETKGSVYNRTGIGISILGVEFSGNLSFSAAKDAFLWSADQSIYKKLGLFSVKETFYASPSENTAKHSVNLDFSSDFYTKFGADAIYEYSKLERRWNLLAGYSHKNIYVPSVSVNAKAFWTEKDARIEEDDSYGKLYAMSWEPLIPDAGRGADARKTQTQIVITEGTKPVGAVVTAEGSTNFTGANSAAIVENSLFLDVPLSLKNSSISFRAGRSLKRQVNYSGEDALHDGRLFFESIGDSLPLWEIFPGYSLFAPELNGAMDKTVFNSPTYDNALYTAFFDHFSAKIGLPTYNNFASFFVPSSVSVRLERVLEQKLDIRSDMLNFGGGVGYSITNMFGAMGYRPIFKFYHSDEFLHALECAFIFPVDEDVSWRVQSVASAGFRGFSGAVLNFVNTLVLRSGDLWTESVIADWTVPVQKSLLGVFYNWIASQSAKQSSWLAFSTLLNTKHENLRKESLELAMENREEYFRVMVVLGHESIIRILGKLNLSAFAKLRFSEESQSEAFTFDAVIGTSLRVIF